MVEVDAIDVHTALGTPASALEMARALMEFAAQVNRVFISFTGANLRARHVVPSPAHVFWCDPGGTLDAAEVPVVPTPTSFGAIGHADGPPPDNHWARLCSWAPLFSEEPKPSSTRGLIADMLRLYAIAMDQPVPDHALMYLWQAAERAGLADGQKDKGREVCDRLSFLEPRMRYGSGEGTLSGILTHLMRKRNQIVHHGHQRVSEEADVAVLKDVCSALILWLMEHESKLPTIDHIRHFYTWRSSSPLIIERVEQALEFLRSQRPT